MARQQLTREDFGGMTYEAWAAQEGVTSLAQARWMLKLLAGHLASEGWGSYEELYEQAEAVAEAYYGEEG